MENGIFSTILIILSVTCSFAVLFFLWAFPIKKGIGAAKKAGVSPYWMWFGIHPLSGWIAYLILKRASDFVFVDNFSVNWKSAKVKCYSCGEVIKIRSVFCEKCGIKTVMPECPKCGGHKTVFEQREKGKLINLGIGSLLAGSCVFGLADTYPSEFGIAAAVIGIGLLILSAYCFIGIGNIKRKYLRCLDCKTSTHVSEIKKIYIPD